MAKRKKKLFRGHIFLDIFAPLLLNVRIFNL
jgi:hypothetical protein